MSTEGPSAALAKSKPDFCVVGIGASSGGLDALRTLFSRMPTQPGFACVVVVHLSPQHESHLVEMLQPYTQMPVCQVVRTTPLEPNRVYVIPPNANLNSIDTHLRLSELETRRTRRAPIDHFLRTLALTHGETAIGVILSGAGSDGALGMRQIKERGGLTIVQEPREAEYGSMPQSAIATGTVDLVMSARDIAQEIRDYCCTQPWTAVLDANDGLDAQSAALVEKILGEVRVRTGQEFAMYKRAMILQRIRRRMRLAHVSTLQEYFDVVRTRAEEPRALYNDLLLNVVEFFRDAEATERLLREILARKDGGDGRIRVWSMGCSTGEEAYTLAMLLLENSSRRDRHLLPQIFASELSSNVLQQAREGVYPQEIATWISQERLDRFFTHEDGRYRVRHELREMVTFAMHDLFKDPPFAHLDLIVCRNLLRDLQPAMRQGVLALFFYALEPQGSLLIDVGDDVDIGEMFSRDATQPELLRRLSGPKRPMPLPSSFRPFARFNGEHSGALIFSEAFDVAAIFGRAIERYTPPSVLVDENNQVVHFSSSAARYVRIPGGEMTLDILSLVPEPISTQLGMGLAAARSEKRAWQSEPILASTTDHVRRIVLRIEPANAGSKAPGLLLVVFDDASEFGTIETGADQVQSLRRDLALVQQQLVSVSTKAQRAAQERERPNSDPEELRAALEALDTAREELQAINEELLSVNEENQHRMVALTHVSGELQQLLSSSGYATLLVDRTLKVLRFTPLAAAALQLRDTDLGRPIGELRHAQLYPNFISDLGNVVQHHAEVEQEFQSENGAWFLLRAQPYRTALHGVDGAVVLLVDITSRKTAELALRESDRRKEEFLAVLAHELRNPIAPIAAGIEVLQKLPEDSALVLRVAATMSRQTKQLVRLVDDLLEVGRINEGKLMLRHQTVLVSDVIRDAVATLRPVLDTLEHRLTVELPDEALLVHGDAARLGQVVGNLLHNAARYTAPHGQIKLRAGRNDGQLQIIVQDNGRGIVPEALESVFEMFYQDRESGAAEAGLGIGLTLAKKLVELHGGTIIAESAGLGRGSTFTVQLPLASHPAVNNTTDVPQEQKITCNHHRVLIVDDNTDAAETMRLLVQSIGAGDVRTAASGQEALEAGTQLRPDIVLLDLSMPGMDGYEVARRMRAEPWGKAALLIALTGWGQEQHRRRSQEAGFDRHLIKPADMDALRSVLQN